MMVTEPFEFLKVFMSGFVRKEVLYVHKECMSCMTRDGKGERMLVVKRKERLRFDRH